MKIINNNILPFENIPVGGIFRSDKNPNILFIKTPMFWDGDEIDYNAIDITTGDFACIDIKKMYSYFPDVAIYLQGVSK